MKEDAQLIDETLAGQTGAFGQLVLKYQDRLYGSVVHVLGSAEDARDVVQDAFVQAFTKLDTFKRNSAFFTWLYRIAFNLAVSHRRRHRAVGSIDQARDMAGIEPIDDGLSPEDCLQQHDRAVQVRRALAELAEDYRTILVLREMDDCSYDTIAEILDLPVGTVRSRLHRARMQLREALRRVMQAELG